MAQVRGQEAASHRLDEIHRYTRARWGVEQADRYINGLFDAFGRIESRQTIPAAIGVSGYFFRHERHSIYWRWLGSGDMGIVTILHAGMQRIDHFREDFGL